MSALGAISTTFTDNADQPLYEPEPGTYPTWQQTKITGLFKTETDTVLIQSLIANELKAHKLRSWQIESLEDRGWTRTWMDHFLPLQFGHRLARVSYLAVNDFITL